MGREQDLVARLAGQDELTVGEVAVAQIRVDADFEEPLVKGEKLLVGEAESPVLVVVGRPVWGPGWPIRQRVEVRTQLDERHRRADGHAVADDVQVRGAEVDDPTTRRVLDVGVADCPLARDGPIEHLRPGRHLVDLERDEALEDAQGFAHAFPGNAPRKRVEFLDQVHHPLTDRRPVELPAVRRHAAIPPETRCPNRRSDLAASRTCLWSSLSRSPTSAASSCARCRPRSCRAAGSTRRSFIQENQSRSRHRTIRGLHFRRELRERKVVRCARGEVFAVVVDLRPWSATFRPLGARRSRRSRSPPDRRPDRLWFRVPGLE